ncbi:hypothetical protein [Georgenia sp. SUBG003]
MAPDAEGTIWWHDVLEESVRHTVGVSQGAGEPAPSARWACARTW